MSDELEFRGVVVPMVTTGTMRPVFGLTMGDPAGIGPELRARALRERSVLDVVELAAGRRKEVAPA